MSQKTKYRGSYIQHNDFGYFCISCYNFTNKIYYLKKVEDSTGIAWKCPHCKFIIANFIIKNYWKQRLEIIKPNKDVNK